MGIQNCQIIKAQYAKLNTESSLSEMHTSSDVLVFTLGQSGRVRSYVTSGTEINVNCFQSITSNVSKPRSVNIFKTLALRQSTISITS